VGPAIPLQDDVPLYGPSGQPQENDIQQAGTSDCFLQASVAAIVRTDLQKITAMLSTPSDNQVTVIMYGTDGKEDKLQVELQDLNDRYSANNSKSSWLAVIQEAYSQLLKSENSPDAVHNGEGGSSADVIKAIHGNKARTVYGICSKGGIDFVGKKAISKPATFSTTDEEGGQLVNDHAYTIHSSDGSHIELRNPWGKEKTGGPDIHNIGDGVLELSIATALKQCNGLRYVDIVTPDEALSASLSSSSASAAYVKAKLTRSESAARASFDTLMEAANAAATGTLDPAKAVYTFDPGSNSAEATTTAA